MRWLQFNTKWKRVFAYFPNVIDGYIVWWEYYEKRNIYKNDVDPPGWFIQERLL